MQYKWYYKDSYRMYWLVTAEIINHTQAKGDDYYETEWGVAIYRDFIEANEDSSCVFDSVIMTQFDEPIRLKDILAAWANYNQNVMFGMIKYVK